MCGAQNFGPHFLTVTLSAAKDLTNNHSGST
jgi:hypothetical protein